MTFCLASLKHRVRLAPDDPLVKFMRDNGYELEPEGENFVLTFPLQKEKEPTSN